MLTVESLARPLTCQSRTGDSRTGSKVVQHDLGTSTGLETATSESQAADVYIYIYTLWLTLSVS